MTIQIGNAKFNLPEITWKDHVNEAWSKTASFIGKANLFRLALAAAGLTTGSPTLASLGLATSYAVPHLAKKTIEQLKPKPKDEKDENITAYLLLLSQIRTNPNLSESEKEKSFELLLRLKEVPSSLGLCNWSDKAYAAFDEIFESLDKNEINKEAIDLITKEIKIQLTPGLIQQLVGKTIHPKLYEARKLLLRMTKGQSNINESDRLLLITIAFNPSYYGLPNTEKCQRAVKSLNDPEWGTGAATSFFNEIDEHITNSKGLFQKACDRLKDALVGKHVHPDLEVIIKGLGPIILNDQLPDNKPIVAAKLSSLNEFGLSIDQATINSLEEALTGDEPVTDELKKAAAHTYNAIEDHIRSCGGMLPSQIINLPNMASQLMSPSMRPILSCLDQIICNEQIENKSKLIDQLKELENNPNAFGVSFWKESMLSKIDSIIQDLESDESLTDECRKSAAAIYNIISTKSSFANNLIDMIGKFIPSSFQEVKLRIVGESVKKEVLEAYEKLLQLLSGDLPEENKEELKETLKSLQKSPRFYHFPVWPEAIRKSFKVLIPALDHADLSESEKQEAQSISKAISENIEASKGFLRRDGFIKSIKDKVEKELINSAPEKDQEALEGDLNQFYDDIQNVGIKQGFENFLNKRNIQIGPIGVPGSHSAIPKTQNLTDRKAPPSAPSKEELLTEIPKLKKSILETATNNVFNHILLELICGVKQSESTPLSSIETAIESADCSKARKKLASFIWNYTPFAYFVQVAIENVFQHLENQIIAFVNERKANPLDVWGAKSLNKVMVAWVDAHVHWTENRKLGTPYGEQIIEILLSDDFNNSHERADLIKQLVNIAVDTIFPPFNFASIFNTASAKIRHWEKIPRGFLTSGPVFITSVIARSILYSIKGFAIVSQRPLNFIAKAATKQMILKSGIAQKAFEIKPPEASAGQLQPKVLEIIHKALQNFNKNPIIDQKQLSSDSKHEHINQDVKDCIFSFLGLMHLEQEPDRSKTQPIKDALKSSRKQKILSNQPWIHKAIAALIGQVYKDILNNGEAQLSIAHNIYKAINESLSKTEQTSGRVTPEDIKREIVKLRENFIKQLLKRSLDQLGNLESDRAKRFEDELKNNESLYEKWQLYDPQGSEDKTTPAGYSLEVMHEEINQEIERIDNVYDKYAPTSADQAANRIREAHVDALLKFQKQIQDRIEIKNAQADQAKIAARLKSFTEPNKNDSLVHWPDIRGTLCEERHRLLSEKLTETIDACEIPDLEKASHACKTFQEHRRADHNEISRPSHLDLEMPQSHNDFVSLISSFQNIAGQILGRCRKDYFAEYAKLQKEYNLLNDLFDETKVQLQNGSKTSIFKRCNETLSLDTKPYKSQYHTEMEKLFEQLKTIDNKKFIKYSKTFLKSKNNQQRNDAFKKINFLDMINTHQAKYDQCRREIQTRFETVEFCFDQMGKLLKEHDKFLKDKGSNINVTYDTALQKVKDIRSDEDLTIRFYKLQLFGEDLDNTIVDAAAAMAGIFIELTANEVLAITENKLLTESWFIRQFLLFLANE